MVETWIITHQLFLSHLRLLPLRETQTHVLVVVLATEALILPSLEQHIACASVMVWLRGHPDQLTISAKNLPFQKC